MFMELLESIILHTKKEIPSLVIVTSTFYREISLRIKQMTSQFEQISWSFVLKMMNCYISKNKVEDKNYRFLALFNIVKILSSFSSKKPHMFSSLTAPNILVSKWCSRYGQNIPMSSMNKVFALVIN